MPFDFRQLGGHSANRFSVSDTCRLYGTVVDMEHHLVRKDGGAFDFSDYITNPHEYQSTFAEKVPA